MVLASVFYNSPEYSSFNNTNAQFVTDNFVAELGRLPDSGGLNYWIGQITSGLPRNIVLNSFLFAPEYSGYMQQLFGTSSSRAEVTVVVNFYGGLLRRLPDTGGFNLWVGRLRTAQCQSAAAVSLAVDDLSKQTSPVPSTWHAIAATVNLSRISITHSSSAAAIWPASISGWGNSTAGALSREQVRQQFLTSPEMQNSIALVSGAGLSAVTSSTTR